VDFKYLYSVGDVMNSAVDGLCFLKCELFVVSCIQPHLNTGMYRRTISVNLACLMVMTARF
jgi:hypothetical protein